MQASKHATLLLRQARYIGSYTADVGTTAAMALVPSEMPLSTHSPISEGWRAELAAGLWFVVSVTGFGPTKVDPTRFETLRLSHLATP